jgi:hypothetical protein
MSGRARWLVGGLAGLALLIGLAFLLHRVGLIGSPFDPADECEVYLKLDFDRHKGNFRPVGATQLERSDDSCGGQALLLRRAGPGGDFGAQLPLFIDGAEGLRIAYLCKAKGMPRAMLNLWDQSAQDNLSPARPVALSADAWTAVRYHVDAFRYNGASELLAPPKRGAFLQSLLLHGEQPGPADTQMLIDNFAVYRGPDRTPPGRVEGLRAEPVADGIRLSWQPAADNVGVMRYVIARAAETADAFHTIAETAAPVWVDRPPAAGAYCYRVRACDFDANEGDWSEPVVQPFGPARSDGDSR